MELIFNPNDGSGTNPDLLMVSSDIIGNTKREIIEDPGSGHRITINSIRSLINKSKKPKIKTSWNFKKADWSSFQNEIEGKCNILLESEFKSTDEMNKKICEILLTAAKTHIPKGKLKKYSYYYLFMPTNLLLVFLNTQAVCGQSLRI